MNADKIILILINTTILLSLFIEILNGCSTFETPIKINQKDPLLIKAYQDIDALLENRTKQSNIKSFVATIVYMDEIVYEKTIGNINPLDTSSPNITIDSRFRIASISKVITSLAMFKMRDTGIIRSIDDDIKYYFPKFKINSAYGSGSTKITFRELASHQSGLAREVPCDRGYFGTVNCTEKIILDKLSKQFLISNGQQQIQTLSHYSNLGYSLLGRVLGESIKNRLPFNYYYRSFKEQQSYENYVMENIFKPLGMLNTTFNVNTINVNTLARGIVNNGVGKFKLADITSNGWNSPSGGVFSTARDMSKLLMLYLNGNTSFISDSSLSENLQPINLLNDGNSSYGISFLHTYNGGEWIKSKDGELPGYLSQFVMSTQYKIGLMFTSLYATSTAGNLFTTEVLGILIPVYKQLIRDEYEKKQKQPTSIGIDISLFFGNYKSDFGTLFVIFNSTLTSDNMFGYLARVNGEETIIHSFESYPLIKRVKLINPTNQSCRRIAGGSDGELIYFTLKNIQTGAIIDVGNFNFYITDIKRNIKNYKIYSVQVMGSTLYKL